MKKLLKHVVMGLVLAVVLGGCSHYETALKYYERGEYDEAALELEEATKTNPDDIQIRLKLAEIYKKRGMLDAAISEYKAVVEIAPDYEYYRRILAGAYQATKKYEEAVAEYQEAIQLAPNLPWGYMGVAGVHNAKGEKGEAITWYKKAVEVAPEVASPYIQLGHRYRELKEYDEAKAWYEKAMKVEPANLGVYTSLGYTYRLEGEMDEALLWYEKAVELAPDNEYYHRALAGAYQAAKRYDEAIAEYKEAIRLAPDKPDGYAGLAYTYRVAGKLDGAIAEYKKRVELIPDNTTAHYISALLYEQKGEKDLAITKWETFIKLVPSGRLAEEARKHLEKLKEKKSSERGGGVKMKKLAIVCGLLVLLFFTMPGWAAFKLTDNLSLILYYGRDQNEEKIGSELITTYTSYPKIGFRYRFPSSLIITPTYERKYKQDRSAARLVSQINETTILSLSKRLGKLNYIGDLSLSGHYKFTNFVNQLNKEANQQTEEILLRIVATPGYHWRWTGEYTVRNTNKVYSQSGSQSWIPRLELYQKVSRKTSLAYGYKQETITYLPEPGKTYVKRIPSIRIWRTLTDKLSVYAMFQSTSQDRVEAGQPIYDKTTTEVLVESRYEITDKWNIMGRYKVIGARENISDDRSISTVELGYTWKFDKKILGTTIRINPLIGYEYTDYFSKEKDSSDLGRFYFKVRATY